MADNRDDAYSAFAQDHRELGAPKGEFSPTLRIKVLGALIVSALVFWGTVIYLIAR